MVNCIVIAEICLHPHKCHLQATLRMDNISDQNRTVASFFFFFQSSSHDFVFRINIAVCVQATEVL